MTATAESYKVEKAGTNQEWKHVYSGPEDKALEMYERQLKLYSVGKFRLVGPDGKVVKEQKAALFQWN